MKVQIYGKNITVTPAIAEKIEKKLNMLNKYFIIEGSEVSLMFFDGELLSVSVPEKVELTVAETDPAIKGAPSNQTKDATLETGLKIRVPQFIEQGEKIIVYTADGSYSGRA